MSRPPRPRRLPRRGDGMEAASIAHVAGHDDHEHHGPPAANRSSRVEAPLLGMALFIISEVMIFGAFFTAYFFIRIAQGEPWPAPGTHLPELVAGINTAILMSSSFTLHWAQSSIKKGNRFGLKAGMLLTFAPQDHAQQTIFYALTGLHGAHVFIGLLILLSVTVRSFRGHYSADSHRGVEVPGIYWHFVDIMWIIVYTSVYVL